LNRLLNYLRQFFQVITAPFRMLSRLPLGVISAPRRLMGMSLPARVALVTAILLLVCAIVAFVSLLLTEDAAHFWNYFAGWRKWVIPLLLIVIPVVVYFAVKSWLEGEVSQYPDIDEAWHEGLAALRENGLDLTDLPFFLVLGTEDEGLIKSVFNASRMDFLIRHVPSGRKPLHWYADENSIFLVCRDVSHLSRLNSLAATRPVAASAPAPTRSPDNIKGTLPAGGTVASSDLPRPEPEESGEPDFGGDGLRGTLVPGAMSSTPSHGAVAQPQSSSGVALSRRDAEEQVERLRYLCRLLVRSRQPLCPINGILTLLPLNAVSDVMVAKEMPGAVQNDLGAIRQTTRLCCPVTSLVTGMEVEPGFTELVRRVGAARAKDNRFGKGFNVWNPPTAECIDAFSAHACGSFEDWVYSLFREPDGLSKPGNAKLYSLLCKIRSQLRSRLRNILLHGYSFEPGEGQADEAPLLFSGCYFAATGNTEDRQAFVKNVFEKMLELEEELDWTDEALIEDDRYHAVARFGMGISSLLVIGIIAMFVYKFYSQGS